MTEPRQAAVQVFEIARFISVYVCAHIADAIAIESAIFGAGYREAAGIPTAAAAADAFVVAPYIFIEPVRPTGWRVPVYPLSRHCDNTCSICPVAVFRA